ncbi:HTH-type transcriptional regulator AbgR [Chromobacterium violaceum]|uniref:HTH-type transcriptional regulator AbgR n=1 Tax=Chromobacterium violaceum TaxID=536 RepID=A0A3S4HSU5_CHRVL|nr:HTH-type transcriptional regulator AbgR [Chromobacterium violaceum]
MDRLTAMQVFAEVAQLGSFTAAGDKLDMSRPMVTRYVEELEQWLGVRLLQRSTRKVTLTDAGLACLARCRQMLDLADEVRADASQRDGQVRGLLRVAASTSFGLAVLGGAVAEFGERHPQLRVDLQLGDRAVNLIEERIDLAIRITNEPDPAWWEGGYAIAARCWWPRLLPCPPRHAERAGGSGEPPLSQLQQFRPQRMAVAEGRGRIESAGRRQHQRQRSQRAPERHAGRRRRQPAASYLAAPYVRRGELAALLPAWQPAVLGIHALYPSRRLLPLSLRSLLDFLVEKLGGPEAPWDRG